MNHLEIVIIRMKGFIFLFVLFVCLGKNWRSDNRHLQQSHRSLIWQPSNTWKNDIPKYILANNITDYRISERHIQGLFIWIFSVVWISWIKHSVRQWFMFSSFVKTKLLLVTQHHLLYTGCLPIMRATAKTCQTYFFLVVHKVTKFILESVGVIYGKLSKLLLS